MVRIDAGQMESALLNLCLNAAQAISGPGRIDLRLSLAPSGMARIEVADTGSGMPPEVLARLDTLINEKTVAGDRYSDQANREVDTEVFERA